MPNFPDTVRIWSVHCRSAVGAGTHRLCLAHVALSCGLAPLGVWAEPLLLKTLLEQGKLLKIKGRM